MGQHLPTVTLSHIPDKEKDKQRRETEIRLQTPVFSPVSSSYPVNPSTAPAATRSQGPSLERCLFTTDRWQETEIWQLQVELKQSQKRGNTWRQWDSKDKEQGSLQGATRWRYGRGFVLQNKALVLCPGANTCDKGESGNVDAGGCLWVTADTCQLGVSFTLMSCSMSGGSRLKQYPGQAACQEPSVSVL